MDSIFLLLFIKLASFLISAHAESVIVTTPLGKVEGVLSKSFSGKPYSSFEGVPYAKPPIKKFRFQEPNLIKRWRGIWQANTVYKCMQLSQIIANVNDSYSVTGDEDCLYLNVYSPNITKSAGLDVIIFIHGGMFMYNHGGMWGPKFMVDKKIILVTINYRLGPLGFFSTGDDVAPGNNGLKDQIVAMRWVKNNIEFFGGNPNSITIAGETAGGASVHIHYLSKSNEDLFQRGVAMSGTALNSWAISKDTVENSKTLAKMLGCIQEDNRELVECLKKRPARQIVEAVKNFLKFAYIPYSPFGVVIDKWSKNPVVGENPLTILSKKNVLNVPIIFSNTDNDALLHAADFLLQPDYMKYFEESWNIVMPFILDFNSLIGEEEKNMTSTNIFDFYIKEPNKMDTAFKNITKMMDDRLYKENVKTAVLNHTTAITSPVYYYYYSFKKPNTRANINLRVDTDKKIVDDLGPSQGDDVKYVFGNEPLKAKDEKEMSKKFLDMWFSYAHTGVPTISKKPLWLPIDCNGEVLRGIHIKSPSDIKIQNFNNTGNPEFWHSLPFKENFKLQCPKQEL